MNFELNFETISKIQGVGLSIEEWVVLLLLKEGEFDLLNTMDKNSSSVKYAILYQKLFRENWIETDSTDGEQLFKLSLKAQELLQNIEN